MFFEHEREITKIYFLNHGVFNMYFTDLKPM